MNANLEILEQSFAKVKPRGAEFAASFYNNLFQDCPQLQPLFNNTNIKKQEEKLLASLVLLVESLRQPEMLMQVLRDLGARHKGYGVLAKHYPMVGMALIKTFKQYLQEDWTKEIEHAWIEIFSTITKAMLAGAGEVADPPATPEDNSRIILDKTEPASFQPEAIPPSETEPEGFSGWNYDRLRQLLSQSLDLFWQAPTWLVVAIAVTLFLALIPLAENDFILKEILEYAETISIFVGLVLLIKEYPERKKEFHYQAWSLIDAAKGNKISYARFLALQDLNQDGVALKGLELMGAELAEIELNRVDLSNANLRTANLTNAKLYKGNCDRANLSKANLSGVDLRHGNLSFANLSRSNLSSADLSQANLVCADLSNANLSGVNLSKANLSGAKLQGAYLSGANLKDAQVIISDLKKAYLTDAVMPDGSIHN